MSDMAFHDLPEDAFPFMIEFIRMDTNAVVHTITVTGPGAVHVPPLGRELGAQIDVRIVDAP